MASPSNQMPVISSFRADTTNGPAPLTVNFSAAASDPDGSIALAEWWCNGHFYGKVDPDLKTIVLTALDKDPARRYQSVAAMAEDIRRYLANEPIVARAPSTWYQVKKMVGM